MGFIRNINNFAFFPLWVTNSLTEHNSLLLLSERRTMNGNIEVTDNGESVIVSKGNNLIFSQGHGVITTKDGSETANHTFIGVGNGTELRGASVFSTNSTGELSFLNNILGIFKSEADGSGIYESSEWQWK
jgi:hypothetical protein